jgi:hypothetical protein
MFIQVDFKKNLHVHFGFMNIILLNSDHRPVVIMYYSYVHKTKVHVLVFLINFLHLINARNVEHIKLICVSSSIPCFVNLMCRGSVHRNINLIERTNKMQNL